MEFLINMVEKRILGAIDYGFYRMIPDGGEGSWGDPGSKPGYSRRILSGRRTGGYYGRMPDTVEESSTKKEGKRGTKIWDGYWGLRQQQQVLWRVQSGLPVWQCVRSINASWTKDPGHHAGQEQIREKRSRLW